MHPVQAAPRQSHHSYSTLPTTADAPRAGSAEAKNVIMGKHADAVGCTPCRQRRGKESMVITAVAPWRMHPVQAAPRQSVCVATVTTAVLDALRAGSAEAKSG